MAFTMLKSVVGRRLGLSSTGGILAASESTALDSAAVMRDSTGAVISPHYERVANTTSTGGATLSAEGVHTINTSATAATFLIAAPVAGKLKEIYIVSSASALTFGGTSTAQVFMKIAGTSAGSTTLTLTDADLAGQALILRGLSATQWGVVSGSTVIQA